MFWEITRKGATKYKLNTKNLGLSWFAGMQSTNVYDIKPTNDKSPVHTVNQCKLQYLERTQEDKWSKDPYASHQGLQVPSYNPKVSQNKSPLKSSNPYATISKGEPPTLSLGTTAGVGSGGLRKA